MCVCVCVCVCVCGGGRKGTRIIHDASKEEKTPKSTAKSTHEELENHKNIRFQIERNDRVILANKQEVKNQFSCLEFVPKINKWNDWNKKILSGESLRD